MRGSDAGEASSLGFDHGAEVVAPKRSLLLQVGSDGFEVVVGQSFAQQRAVGFGACFRSGGQCDVFGMRREKGILAKVAVAGAA